MTELWRNNGIVDVRDFFYGEKGERGQMTVELVAVLPVLLAVALIATNALLFMSECAAFDRVARGAVRISAFSESGRTLDESAREVCFIVERAMAASYLEFSAVAEEVANGHVAYTVEMTFSPTLFGMTFRSELWGMRLPSFRHEVVYVVDLYKPGVIV